MILSNEPGYYRAGEYGIRIENLHAGHGAGGDRRRRAADDGFETLTLAPIDRRLIDPALLTPAERAWLDAYHARVLRELGPALDAETRDWLKDATAPLSD